MLKVVSGMQNKNRHGCAGSLSWRVASLPSIECFRAVGLRHHYVRHSHEGFAIGVFEDGVGGTNYRGATHYIAEGAIVAMNPEEPHTGYAADGRGLTYRMVYLEPAFFEETLRLRCRPAFPDVSIDDRACARQLADAHARLERDVDRLGAETGLIDVLSALAIRHGGSRGGPRGGEEPAAVARAKEFLREHAAERLSIRDVAAAAGLSPAHFIRTFRRAVGIPPHAWQLQTRVELAKPLLAAGRPVADLALDLGFADQSHFTRRFRAITGVTPARYVEAHRRTRRPPVTG